MAGKIKVPVALLTPEFPSETNESGGIGNYVYKLGKYLNSIHFSTEVFVISKNQTEVINYDGIRVQRINIFRSSFFNLIRKILNKLLPFPITFLSMLYGAWLIGRYVNKREREVNFEFIQSANWWLTGYFVFKKKNRPHILRLSDSRILWDETDGVKSSIDSKIIEWITCRYIRKADYVYAPSKFLADFYNKLYKLNVNVIYPPAPSGIEFSKTGYSINLPNKFFIHFAGTLGKRKGTDIVIKTFIKALEYDNSMVLLLIGRISTNINSLFTKLVGIKNVRYLGPVEKPALYYYIKNAEASILPSIADNIPNTTLESLALGIPVVCFNTGSNDEIIENGINGVVANINHTDDLCNIYIDLWNGKIIFDNLKIKEDLQVRLNPERNIKNLLKEVELFKNPPPCSLVL